MGDEGHFCVDFEGTGLRVTRRPGDGERFHPHCLRPRYESQDSLHVLGLCVTTWQGPVDHLGP